jgi:hypothetical protein
MLWYRFLQFSGFIKSAQIGIAGNIALAGVKPIPRNADQHLGIGFAAAAESRRCGRYAMTVIKCPNCGVANTPQSVVCHCCCRALQAAPPEQSEVTSPSARAQAGVSLSDAYFESESRPIAQTEYSLSCPQCDTPYESGLRFCCCCGKALPRSVNAGPQAPRSWKAAIADTGKTFRDELLKYTRKAGRNFLCIAVLVALLGVNNLGDAITGNPATAEAATRIVLANFLIGAFFLALALRARSEPLQAIVGGLFLYAFMGLLFIEIDAQGGHPERVTMMLATRLTILCILIQTTLAGFKHRRLRTLGRQYQ